MYIHYNTKQTTLPLEISSCLANDHIVFSIEEFMEQFECPELDAMFRIHGRPSYHPKMMLSAILYSYSRGIYSGRKIAELMTDSLSMQYLTGQLIASYRTINRFRVLPGMEKVIEELFVNFNCYAKMKELVTLDTMFVDGTKIEADANKYTHVWKKATDKFQTKLQHTLKTDFVDEIQPLINQAIQDEMEEEITPEHLKEFAQLLEEELQHLDKDIREQPTKGKDPRKTKRRAVKKVLNKVQNDYLVRLEKYNHYQSIFDGRNSFSKTDTDATFMRMKDDHMKNGQLKPGYNLQIGTENQFVLHFDVFPNPTDTLTLLPFLDSCHLDIKTLVADAGYGSEENLLALNDKGIEHYIKYNTFDKEQTRKYQKSSKNMDNWTYDKEQDSYTHPEGFVYTFSHIEHRKTTTGFHQEIKVYKTNQPDQAPQKGLYINDRYQILKNEAKEALLSAQGQQIFAQRKIDVEPVFGQIKACLGYTRCNLRGKRKVKIDMGLVLMANNLKKLNKHEGKRLIK